MTTPIEVDVDSLGSITNDVWTTFVAEDAVVLPLEDVPAHDGADLSSRVMIEGDAVGSVVVRCDRASAVALTQCLFGATDDAEPDEDDIVDALGEVANIVGGNVKSLSIGESRLTLPAVGASVDVEDDDVLMCAAEVIWAGGRATLAVGRPRELTARSPEPDNDTRRKQ